MHLFSSMLLNVFLKELLINMRTSLLFHNVVRTFPPLQSARVHRYSNMRCDSYSAFDNAIHNFYRWTALSSCWMQLCLLSSYNGRVL